MEYDLILSNIGMIIVAKMVDLNYLVFVYPISILFKNILLLC